MSGYEADLRQELAELDHKLKPHLERRAHLLNILRSRPHVEPVLVYWRYGRKYEVPSGDETVEGALQYLEMLEDDGKCSGRDVKVGGCFIPRGDS